MGCGWNTWFPSGLVYNAPCNLSKSPCPWEPALLTPRLPHNFRIFTVSLLRGRFYLTDL